MKKFLVLLFISFFSINLFSLELYKSNVTASFYGADFHGKKTSNGELFNMNDLTCAHKSLPFDTILKVTNLENGKSVNVRVNDRGPFVLNREIDLSTQAAKDLDMVKSGTVKVKLEIVKKGPNTKLSVQTAKSAAAIMAKRYPNSVKKSSKNDSEKTVVAEKKSAQKVQNVNANDIYNIQVGAFSTKAAANKTAQLLLKNDFKNVVFQTSKSTGVVRVVIKNVPGKEVENITKKLHSVGIFEYLVKKSVKR